MMTLNTVLAQRIITQIELEPESHDQDSWVSRCGTKRCAAGWACYLAGDKLDRGLEEATTLDGDVYLIPTRAAELLGLTEEEAGQLFFTYDNGTALSMLKDVAMGNQAAVDAWTDSW